MPKPCPNCGKPLKTDTAKQCFHCGEDWHERISGSASPDAASVNGPRRTSTRKPDATNDNVPTGTKFRGKSYKLSYRLMEHYQPQKDYDMFIIGELADYKKFGSATRRMRVQLWDTALPGAKVAVHGNGPFATYEMFGSLFIGHIDVTSHGLFIYELSAINISALVQSGREIAGLVRTLGYGVVGGLVNSIEFAQKQEAELKKIRSGDSRYREVHSNGSDYKDTYVNYPRRVFHFAWHEIERCTRTASHSPKLSTTSGFTFTIIDAPRLALFGLSERDERDYSAEVERLKEIVGETQQELVCNWTLDKVLTYFSLNHEDKFGVYDTLADHIVNSSDKTVRNELSFVLRDETRRVPFVTAMKARGGDCETAAQMLVARDVELNRRWSIGCSITAVVLCISVYAMQWSSWLYSLPLLAMVGATIAFLDNRSRK